MANLSRLRRERMFDFLNNLKVENRHDERILQSIAEIENELNEKKYGLVWEEHSEQVDEMMVDNVPIFLEDKSREIARAGDNKYNFLIEGDNLHSLMLLDKTHHESIDVIYIDPPYNTGKEFVYDDNMVGEDDGFKHSKYASFMYRRLAKAKELLADTGVIFISIDDYEMTQLKLLCDSIFGDENCLGVLPTIMNLKGNQDEFGFAGTHEYTLVYAKSKSQCLLGQFPVDDEEVESQWEQDDIGYFKKGANLKSTGVNAPRRKRPNLYYPFYIKEDEAGEITWSLDESFGGTAVYPITNGEEMSWRWQKKTVKAQSYDIIITKTGDGYSIYKKQRPGLGDLPTKKPKSIFYKAEYSSGNGTAQLKDIFKEKVFNNPKPIDLIKDFITIGSTKKDAIILDFFAGSGTTAQAVLALNEEDNGNRKFIICTNNESTNNGLGICESVTYPRVKTVITGFRPDGSKYSNGIPANFKYYKTEFVAKDSETFVDDLIAHTDEMIQLEYGVQIDKDKYISILTDEEANELFENWDKYPNIKAIYVSRHVILNAEQRKLFHTKGVYIIPDYYYREELREVGE